MKNSVFFLSAVFLVLIINFSLVSSAEIPCDQKDVNSDGTVNLLDLIVVRGNLNQEITAKNSKSDINNDTKINILDLIAIRSNLNKRCEDEERDPVIQRDGEDYVIRDGKEYLLPQKTVSITPAAALYIEFNPALPSQICEGEITTITVKGTARFNPTAGDLLNCARKGFALVTWCVSVMEADAWPNPDDDVPSDGADFSYHCDSSKSYDCSTFTFSTIFKGIDLSPIIKEDPGANAEIYATVSGDKVTSMSTSDNDVSIDYQCQCTSGECCNIPTKKFKSSGSQPTGKTDFYSCSGKDIIKTDWYCDGSSNAGKSMVFATTTCGTCTLCVNGQSSCQNSPSSTKCGTIDCDYKDTSCRDYHDVDRKCNGAGSCSAETCNDFTNKPAGTSCSSTQNCDGSGSCVCDKLDLAKCYLGHVDWFDSCGNREGRKESCDDEYEDWYDKCYDNKIYKARDITRVQCDESIFKAFCNFAGWETEKGSYVKTCQFGCVNGNCKVDPNIECFNNADCGTNYYGDLYCSNNNLGKNYYNNYKCNNPGTTSSSCSHDTSWVLVKTCGTSEYSSNYCYNNDVYRDFIERGCSVSIKDCYEKSSVKQKVTECGTPGCTNNQCNPSPITCTKNSDCGTDAWTGSAFCSSGNVYQKWRTYTCNSPGTTSSSCTSSDSDKKKEDCTGTFGCSNGVCVISNTGRINLKAGNNVFSVPRKSDDVTFNDIFSLGDTNCQIVYENGHYDLAYFVPADTTSTSNYVYMDYHNILFSGQGYYIKVKNDCYIDIEGEKILSSELGYWESGFSGNGLKTGWNLIGAPSIATAFNAGTCQLYDNIGIMKYGYNVSSCSQVSGWNGAYEDCNIQNGITRCKCPVNSFEPGLGYWIRTKNDCKLG